MLVDGVRDDVLAEVGVVVVEQPDDEVAVEDVDAHRREQEVFFALDPEAVVGITENLQRVQHGLLLRLLDEADDALLLVDLHDAEALGLITRHGNRRHRQVCIRLDVLRDDAAEIHPVELVAAEDDEILEVVVEEVCEVLANGVGGAFIPGSAGRGLFRCEDFNKPAGEVVELVGLRNVPVQRRGVELREDVDAFEVRVDAVRDRNVHQTVFAGEWNGGLGAFLGQRKEARAGSSAHDDGEDVAGVGRHSFALR